MLSRIITLIITLMWRSKLLNIDSLNSNFTLNEFHSILNKSNLFLSNFYCHFILFLSPFLRDLIAFSTLFILIVISLPSIWICIYVLCMVLVFSGVTSWQTRIVHSLRVWCTDLFCQTLKVRFLNPYSA